MKAKPSQLGKITEELDAIMKEFNRVQVILNNPSISKQKKQLVDQDRWKRKFKQLFAGDKNKSCICFDSIESAHTFAKSGLIT